MTAELQDALPGDPTAAPDSPPEPAKKPDLDVLLAPGGVLKIAGVSVTVRRIKAREFLALINILTAGLQGRLGTVMKAAQSTDPDEVQSALLAAFIAAAPSAPDEFIYFIRQIVAANVDTDRATLAIELENPDPDVVLDVLGLLVLQEKDDLAALAGKVQAWIAKIQGAFNPTPTTAG